MSSGRFLRYLIPVLLLAASQHVAAQANTCAAMDSTAPAWFDDLLSKAEQAHNRGNNREAYEHLYRAQFLPVRVDVSINARCVGPALWQRFYDVRRKVTWKLGRQAEKSGVLLDPEGAFDWFVLGDSREDVERVLHTLKLSSDGCSRAGGRLDGAIGIREWASNQGVTLIADEASAAAFYRGQREVLVAWATDKATEILAEEDAMLKSDTTADEVRFESAEEQAFELAAAMVGEDALDSPNDARREARRAKESIQMIRDAERWVGWIGIQHKKFQDRANLRGDAFLAKANDANFRLEVRDTYYEIAEDYYGFSWFADPDRVRRVAEGRAAIAPTLDNERAQRAARLEASQEEFVNSAREMEKSMQQSEEERKAFEEEADALEAELDF